MTLLLGSPADSACFAAAATSSRETGQSHFSECVFFFDNETLQDCYFPLDKDCRPLTASELLSESVAVEESRMKELTSWLANKTGVPILRKDYEQTTGLKGLPSRWVDEYKRKEGRRVVKCRLCLKGFAERNQDSLVCASFPKEELRRS